MKFTDTHCHLQFEKYHNRVDEILADATKANVKRFICVGTTLVDSERAIKLALGHRNVWATAGVHPHDAEGFAKSRDSAKKLKSLAQLKRVVAIGETGLDFYRQYSDKAVQEQALRTQIEVGIELKLPLIFHVRDAWEDFWRIFDSYKTLAGVVHSFSSSQEQVEEALSRGLFVGLNGIMTFTKETPQLEAAKAVPLNRLLLETDAPFLTPAPFRGDICEPKHIATIAEFLAELRGESLEKLANATEENVVKLFGINR